MGFFHPLSLNAPYRNGEAEEDHCRDNGENEGKMWKVGSRPEVVSCERGCRADPAEIEEIPKSKTTHSQQLRDTIPYIAQVKLINSKHSEEEGQNERSNL